MAETTFTNATQILEPFQGVKRVTLEEYFTSGHRTCQGCESALVMKLMVKAAGPAHDRARLHRLHVRRQHDVLHDAVGGAVDAHAARLVGLGRARHRGRAQGAHEEGQDEVGADQRHRLLRRRRRRRHGPRRHLGDADPQGVQLADPALRQRVVRQHRHPALGLDAVRRQHHVQPARHGQAPHPHALEEEHGAACWRPATRSAATWPRCAPPTRSR